MPKKTIIQILLVSICLFSFAAIIAFRLNNDEANTLELSLIRIGLSFISATFISFAFSEFLQASDQQANIASRLANIIRVPAYLCAAGIVLYWGFFII